MTRSTLCATLLIGLAAGCSGEPAQHAEATGTQGQALIGGTPSGPDQNYVVQVQSSHGNGCGVLIAPNLVLTARHLVSTYDTTMQFDLSECVNDTSGVTWGANVPISGFSIYYGPDVPAPGATPDGLAQQIFIPNVTTSCGGDVAIILLQQDIPNAIIAPLRLSSGPTVGETFTGIGFGFTQANGSPPTTRQQLPGMMVTAVGPATLQDSTAADMHVISDQYFSSTSGPCFFDSGGPAVDAQTGAVIGLTSAIDNTTSINGTATQPWAYCLNAVGIYTLVSTHADLFTSAFAKSGYAPWIEGYAQPGPVGASCKANQECTSGICYESMCQMTGFVPPSGTAGAAGAAGTAGGGGAGMGSGTAGSGGQAAGMSNAAGSAGTGTSGAPSTEGQEAEGGSTCAATSGHRAPGGRGVLAIALAAGLSGYRRRARKVTRRGALG